MTAADAINQGYGCDIVQLASAGLASEKHQSVMRQSLKRPNYTTSWKELPIARA
ncbi:MAG: DUF4113 domain-containing protein [Burkholderiales bacterium]